MNKNNYHLIIWDYPNQEPVKMTCDKIILWRGFSRKNDVISIPKLTEEWSDSIRDEYLDFIYNLGKFKVRKKSIIESLKIRENFSAWWFGLISEKSNFFKSLYINDIVKLLTFKKWIKDQSIFKISLYSTNENLSNSLHSFCLNKNINFKFIKNQSEIEDENIQYKSYLQKKFFNLPHFVRGIFWLIYKVSSNLPLIFSKVKRPQKNQKKYLFISYLFNMKNSDNENFLYSNYWGELPGKLKEDNTFSTWIHIYVKDKTLPNSKMAAKLIKNLNKNNNYQNHIALFSFLDFKILGKVILDWLFLNLQIKKIQIHKNFPSYKGFNFWYFFKNDWYDSFIGKSVIDNLLYFALFEKAIGECNLNTTITYLLENQGWEIGMLGVCKSFGIKKTIGFSHVGSRYWDLRNFYDLREFSNRSFLKLPRPKILALNNKNNFIQFLKLGYPQNEIKLVESLRHLYLRNNHALSIKNSKNTICLIVIGDYENDSTKYQLSILNRVPKKLLNKLQIIYKPHPASTLKIDSFSSLSMEIREEPLSELLPMAKLAFCGSSTSAGLDAFSYGLKVIVFQDPKILNFSPLRSFKEVSFVMDSFQLEDIIVEFLFGDVYNLPKRDVFELSEGLPLWENLLYKTI